jgi:hypothetical protein
MEERFVVGVIIGIVTKSIKFAFGTRDDVAEVKLWKLFFFLSTS